MYAPKHFEEKDPAIIEQVMRENNFAMLVSCTGNTPVASHIPLEVTKNNEGQFVLKGHMAKANPLWKIWNENNEIMAAFLSPHHYISPSWYNHPNVPTWNYMAVHAYGKVCIYNAEETLALLKEMMAGYEAHMPKPAKFEDVPATMMEKDLAGLIAFEIVVDRIDAQTKMSQNRDAESMGIIIDNLKKVNNDNAIYIANEMEKRLK
jgi:transcriptional regulator